MNQINVFWLSVVVLLPLGQISSAKSLTSAEDRPLNVLLIMADDIGFECFSSYGSEEYSTPQIDALAKQGIRFTNVHSTPLCTPTRVNLMSGKSNVFNYQDFGIYPNGESTFGNHFKDHGYRTAVAGKWQLQDKRPGKGISPTDAGFDSYCLWNLPGGARERYWKPSFVKNGTLQNLPPDCFGPDVMTDFLIEFMTQPNHKPFIAYYPMILVHDPFVPTPDSKDGIRKDKAKRTAKRLKQNYVDMVAYMDKCVGRLVDALDASGQRDNTLIVFTGDNGTNAVLSSELGGQTVNGGKGYTHDYGTHVPLVVNLPGVVPAQQVNQDLIAFSDFFPTLVEAAGLPEKQVEDQDGFSFWPQCLGQPGHKREWIYGYYFPRPYAAKLDNKYNHFEVRYARDKRYKLYDNGDLYDTVNDVMETSPIPFEVATVKQNAVREVLQQAVDTYPKQGQAVNHGKVTGQLKVGAQKRSDHSALATPVRNAASEILGDLESGPFFVTQSWSQEKNFKRPYIVNVPKPNDSFGTVGKQLPVLIFLHGNGGNARGAMRGFLQRHQEIASRYITVFAEGYRRSWNIVAEASEADDIGFVESIIQRLVAYENVDANHFSIMGISNGSALVNQLAIESRLPNVRNYITGVSPLNTMQYDGHNFKAKGTDNGYQVVANPMAGRRLLSISGTNDRLVPYRGGLSKGIPAKDGKLGFVAAEESIFLWAQQMGYSGKKLSAPIRTSGDLQFFSYLDGDVVHIKVNNHGHGATSEVGEVELLKFLSKGRN